MKKYAFLLFILVISSSIFSQEAPTLAPLNPDFVEFIAKQKRGELPLPGSDEFGTGGMPPPGMVNFDDYLKNNKLKSVNFDPVYDMRNTGLLTPVKGQTGNACWAFASMASVESQWLVSGLGTWDLSENNLKYCHGFITYRNTWGNHWMSTAYFARRKGPLIEADDPNAESSSCPTDKIPVGYITDARYLPNDMNTIKQAILDHGAIYTMMYINDIYYNAVNYTYYYPGVSQVNHAVDLVGWDDTKVTAGGTGAWICKNSYGTGWGEAGYFYISYFDHSILDYNAYWPSRIENVPFTEIYGYDDLGNYYSTGYGSNEGYMLVKFVATEKQLLSKIGSYAMAANSTMEVDIYDNFDPVNLTLPTPIFHQSGFSCPMPGYYTFDLSNPLTVEAGATFYVRIRYNTPLYNSPIPYECYILDYSTPDIEENVAWISADAANGSWYLIGSTTTNNKWDPCIKVYAEPYPVSLTWNGNSSNDWNNPSNWTPGQIPDASKDVLIPDAANNPVINQDAAAPAMCRNLTINSGGLLKVNADKAFTVYGTLTNNAGDAGLILESGASLLTMGAVTGSATVNRNINGPKWHFISSPVAAAVSGMFLGKYLQQFDESVNYYSNIVSTTEPLTPGKGFSLWGDINGYSIAYSGLLNTGNISVGLTRSATGNNSGWNLVGNPYPSSINWDASGWTKTNLNNALYIASGGQWATYISGLGTNGGTSFIAPDQGFFIGVAEVGSATLKFNNYVKAHNPTSFFKNSTPGNFIRLEVSGNGYSDEAVVRFLPEATNEFDSEYDAMKLFGYIDESAQIYTIGTIPLTINSLEPGTTEIPMGMHIKTIGKYTVKATEINTIGTIILEDTKTGSLTNLVTNPHTFIFEPGENELRFKLHFNTLSIDENEFDKAIVYSHQQTVFVNLNEQEKADILIYTVTGQLIRVNHACTGANEILIPDPGIYLVKVVTKEDTFVHKVLIP